MPDPHPFKSIFSGIVRLLCRAVTARTFGHDALPAPMVHAILRRLCGSLHRFTVLLARLQSGPIPPRAPRASPTQPAGPTPAGPTSAGPTASAKPFRLPRTRGWLLPLLPVNGAVAGYQLSVLLAQPEMTALVLASPAFARLLRPLIRMLAVDLPPALQPPPKPPRRRRPRPRPAPPDRTLPSRRPSIVVQGSRLPRIVYGPG